MSWSKVRKALHNLADFEGLIQGHSLDDIAGIAGVTRSGAKQAIQYMALKGQIERVRSTGGRNRPNIYRIQSCSTRNISRCLA